MISGLVGRLLCSVGKHKLVWPQGPAPEFASCERCGEAVRVRLRNPPPPPVQPWQIELWEERERAKHMREKDLRARWAGRAEQGVLQTAALIKVTGGDYNGYPDPGTPAIVMMLGEGLCGPWKSGDMIAFWEDGEHTCLDGLEFEIVVEDLFDVGKERR